MDSKKTNNSSWIVDQIEKLIENYRQLVIFSGPIAGEVLSNVIEDLEKILYE